MKNISPVFNYAPYIITEELNLCSKKLAVPDTTYNEGFSFVITPEPGENVNFGYGLYLITIGYENITIFKFYLDWCDCDYSSYYRGKNDIWIEFSDSEQVCRVGWNDKLNMDRIENGEHYKIWLKKDKSIRADLQNTTCFENFWKNSLVAIPTEGSGSNLFYIPHLVWGPKPNYSA